MLLCIKEKKNALMLEMKNKKGAKKEKFDGYMTAWNGRNIEKQNVAR